MATDKNPDLLKKVDELLAGNELQEQARAVLLLRLCQFALNFAPHLVDHYWQVLQPLQKQLPPEAQPELKTLTTTLEESSSVGAKGFTAEMLTLVQSARKQSGPEAVKRGLLEVEEKMRKHFLPFGKGPVWVALVEAWLPIDRSEAIRRLKNVSADLQTGTLTRMNQAKLLSQAEWELAAAEMGANRLIPVIHKILEDSNQALTLPAGLFKQVGASLRGLMETRMQANQPGESVTQMRLYARLLALHDSGPNAALIPDLLEGLYELIVKGGWLELKWLERFDLTDLFFALGVQLKPSPEAVFNPALRDRLAAKTPAHMLNFFHAQWAGHLTDAARAEKDYVDLMSRTGSDAKAEAWYLVKLVRRGFGEKAFALADKSPRASELLPRLRRALICSHPEALGKMVREADMAGDVIGEFLVQGSPQKRAAYLKKVTHEGAQPVPGAMWAGAGTDDNQEGVRGFWKELFAARKTTGEVVKEYLRRNPLYSSYETNLRKEDQFAEVLRINACGDYRYQEVDTALLQALCAWGDEKPEQVKSVLQAMWNAIRPDDNILMIDWLRNALLGRCVNIFSADVNVMTQDYLAWLKAELVNKGRQWQIGKQIITLKYPATSLLQFCVIGAGNISAISSQRKDDLLIVGLQNYEATPALVEAAAQLYNAGKEPLNLRSPVALKPNLVASWQIGIIKNALLAILQALLLKSAGK